MSFSLWKHELVRAKTILVFRTVIEVSKSYDRG